MNSARWNKLKTLFDSTVELPPAERELYLKTTCQGDTTLESEIAQLLAQHDAAGHFLNDWTTPIVPLGSFEPGDLIANRYRVVRRLGVGGMGEVYEATDLQLNERIALKTVRADVTREQKAFERLIQELQLARKVTHPNVCRVFDIGQHGVSGRQVLFLTMELLDGETLAAHLKRESTIPPDEVLRIGRAIADGVRAAHSSGIIHRDLKPANVFLVADGRIVITDFGLARQLGGDTISSLSADAEIIGTPPYMAPELLAGGRATEASDTYAFGVMLHEMLTGWRPWDKRHKNPPSDLPEPWKSPIERALSVDPTQRPQTPAEVIQAIESGSRSEPGPWKRPKLLAMIAVSLSLFALVFRLAGGMAWIEAKWPAGDPGMSSSVKTPAVLLGDIENTTTDPAYDFAASQLVAVAMEQSRYLNIFSRYRISEALGRAGRSPSERLTKRLLLDLARQEGADYVIAGEISKKDTMNQIVLTLVPTSSKRQSRELEASFGTPEQLPALIGKLTAQTRAWLGESPAQINATNAPLEQVTTRSLLAWDRFSRAIRMEAQGRWEDEINLLQSAVELDPEFASAYALLGFQQNLVGNAEAGLSNVTRAYNMRNRATERESYTIAGLYHALRFEFEKEAEEYRTLTSLYPFDDVAERYFAQSLSNELLTQDSIKAGRRALELNPRSYINIGTLAASLMRVGLNDEALSLINGAKPPGRPRPGLSQFEGQAWLGKGDFRKAEECFGQMINAGGSWENIGHQRLAATKILEGRLTEAVTQLESDLALRSRSRDTHFFFQRQAWLAWLYGLEDYPALARTHMMAIADEPATPANGWDLREAAIVMSDSGEFKLVETIVKTIEGFSQSYESNLYPGALAQLRGEVARKRQDYRTGRREFEEAIRLWPDVLTLWSAARFFEQIGESERARGLYTEVLSRKGEIISQHFPGLFELAQLGKARSESKLLNSAEALKNYDSFLKTFGQFSPELSLVKKAAAERDHLSHAVNN